MLTQTWNLNYRHIWLSLRLVYIVHNMLCALDLVLAAGIKRLHVNTLGDL